MKNSVGFTLVELLIAIAVAAVLLSLGAPAFLDSISRARIDSAASSVVGAMNLARSEAIKRARVVTLCSRSKDEDGDPECGAAADWKDGWIVFAAGEPEPVRVGDPLRDIDIATTAVSVVFEANGARSGGVDPVMCVSGQADVVYRVSVSAVGRVTQEKLGTCP